MRCLLTVAALLASAAAQASHPQETKPAKQQTARHKRLLQDLQQISANLSKQPHAYRGNLLVKTPSDASNLSPLEREFSGCTSGKMSWFTMDRWQIASRGERSVARRIPERVPGARRADQTTPPWGQPEGDSPEVPLTPSLLLPHFQHARLGKPEPTDYRGRPAMRVYASWHGKAAKNVVFAATVPSTQHEQVLEALASAAGKGRDHILADATLTYDPATKSWLAATLRFVCCSGKPFADGDEASAPPTGMPAVTTYVLLDTRWQLLSCDPKLLPMPKLDARSMRRLGIKTAGTGKD